MTEVSRCEVCGGPLYEILYGMPTYETFQEIEAGAPMVIAGCSIPMNPASHQCDDCGLEVDLGDA